MDPVVEEVAADQPARLDHDQQEPEETAAAPVPPEGAAPDAEQVDMLPFTLNPRLRQWVTSHWHGDLEFRHDVVTWVPPELAEAIVSHGNTMFNPPLQTVLPVRVQTPE